MNVVNSRNKTANAILDDIFKRLGQRWLFLHYVRSEHNPADVPAGVQPHCVLVSLLVS